MLRTVFDSLRVRTCQCYMCNMAAGIHRDAAWSMNIAYWPAGERPAAFEHTRLEVER